MWSKKEKYRQELIPNTNFQPCRVFAHNDLVERKIKSHRLSSNAYSILCSKRNLILTFLQTWNRNWWRWPCRQRFGYKQSRQLMIEEKLGCKIIRTDPDATDLTSTG